MLTSIRLPKLIFMGACMIALIGMLFNPFINRADAASQSSVQVTTFAQKLIGSKYKANEKGPKTFDSSGFTQYVFEKSVKVKLPRTSNEQYKVGKAIQKKEIKEGDLVFFNTSGKGVSFVGISLGKDKFIAVTVSKGVSIQSLDSKYWKEKYVGAKRVLK